MVYAYDLNIQMPTRDLYDTQIMAMAISAAKDMYDRGLKLLDNFYEKYGDFSSPFVEDLKWYLENVIDKITNTIDTLYKNGEDPIRSLAGRMKIALAIRQIPINKINEMNKNAKIGLAFLENMAKLREKNLYSPEMDLALYGDYRKFRTVNDNGTINSFDRISPDPYYNMNQLLDPIYKQVEPIYDEEATKAANDGMLHSTVTLDRLMKALDDSRKDLLSTPSGRYLMMLAEQEAAIRNKNGESITPRQVFDEWATNRMSPYVRNKPSVRDPRAELQDRIKLENLSYSHEIGKLNKQAELQEKQQQKAYDLQLLFLRDTGQLPDNDEKNPISSDRYLTDRIDLLMNIEKLKNLSPSTIASLLSSLYLGDPKIKPILDKLKQNPKSLTANEEKELKKAYVASIKQSLMQGKKINTSQAKKYWESEAYVPNPASYDSLIFDLMFSGSDSKTEIGKDGSINKYTMYPVNFSGNNLIYAPLRYATLFDGTTKFNLYEDINNIINKGDVEAYTQSGNATLSRVTGSNGTSLELRQDILIPYGDFKKVMESLMDSYEIEGFMGKNDVEGLIKRAEGMKKVTKSGIDFVSIPMIKDVTRQIPEINQLSSKEFFGSSVLAKERSSAESSGLSFQFGGK